MSMKSEQKDTAFIRCVHNLTRKSEALLTHLKTAEEQTVYEDHFIEKIHDLLDERQTIIKELETEAARQNSEVKALVDALISKESCSRLTSMDTEIANELKQVFSHIKDSRQLFQKKQRSRQQYRNPFGSVPRDGMFVDKRK